MIKQYAGADRAITYLFEHAKEVSITPILTSGTLSATLTIDGTAYNLYSVSLDVTQLDFTQLTPTQIADLKTALGIT